MTESVRDECKRRFGNEHCIKVYAADMQTVTGGFDCVGWCPVLKLAIAEDDDEEGGIYGRNS